MKNETNNRWKNYRKANNQFPNARTIEIETIKIKINPLPGEKILECGTGNGILTFKLAQELTPTGSITTYDVTLDNLKSVIAKNQNMGLPIITKAQNSEKTFEENNNSFDKIATIATLHHFDNKIEKTGITGRQKIFKEFSRILKKGGKLIIGDVAQNTPTQKYFDSVDNPIDCFPEGHPHEFLDKQTIEILCKETGFKIISFEIIQTPWRFKNKDEASIFVHTLHNSQKSPNEAMTHLENYLKTRYNEHGYFEIEWSLFFLIAEKI